VPALVPEALLIRIPAILGAEAPRLGALEDP
jgi:hypothetical protein